MPVVIDPQDNLSGTNKPFQPGSIIEDHRGHRFGVLQIEKADGAMSRYLLISCSNGAYYSNQPHYTMKLIKKPTPGSIELVEKTLANKKEEERLEGMPPKGKKI